MIRFKNPIMASDEQPVQAIRRDLTGGINSRLFPGSIAENEVSVLENVDIIISGQMSKRPGSVLIGNDVSNVTPSCLRTLYVQGGTNQLLMYEDTSLWKWEGAGNWSSLKSDFSVATDVGIIPCKESGVSPDDIAIVQTLTNNAFRVDSAGNWQDLGDTNTSPPKSTVGCWYNNRMFFLLNDLFYFSDAYPADYAEAFDRTTNRYRIPVGKEMGLVPSRDQGICVFGEKAIWGIKPSLVPDVTTDQPVPLLADYGCVSKNAWVVVGDDIFFFSNDGLRSLTRTVQDKLQTGSTVPISFKLKNEFNRIAWGYIDRVAMKLFDNKLFISVPTGASTFDTWVYYPSTSGFMVITGWSPSCWETYPISGVMRLYYGKFGNGAVYKAWFGSTDEGSTVTNGTAISYLEEGRAEDMEAPHIPKCGGQVKVAAKGSGNYDLNVYASFDDDDYVPLGTLNLSYGVYLSASSFLPLQLTGGVVKTGVFHIAKNNSWKRMKLKITQTTTNSTDEITILSRQIITFADEYQPEKER